MWQGPHCSLQSSLSIYRMSRSLAEACAQAYASHSTGGVALFISPPLPQPVAGQRQPRLPSKLHDHIMPNHLHPSIIATERFTKWLTPYGIAKLDKAAHSFPIHCITDC